MSIVNLFKRACACAVIALLLFPVTPAQAVIHGVSLPTIAVSTVKISIQHEHFLRSLGTWEYYDSVCSAVIVGRKPLTLLTAAHCLREARLNSSKNLPLVQVEFARESGLGELSLRQAFYRPYEDVAEDLTLDIAVLVFDGKVAAYVQPLSVISDVDVPDQLLICGYGKATAAPDLHHPRCAERPVLPPDADFSNILPAKYQPLDESLYLKSQVQFGYTHELLHEEDALLAINRLNHKMDYDPRLEMPTVGDSGGPWLRLNHQGQYGVYALTSLVERFYNKSLHWDFFNAEVPLTDYPYVAYGLRLGHPLVMNYLQYARNSGADIRFVFVKH